MMRMLPSPRLTAMTSRPWSPLRGVRVTSSNPAFLYAPAIISSHLRGGIWNAAFGSACNSRIISNHGTVTGTISCPSLVLSPGTITVWITKLDVAVTARRSGRPTCADAVTTELAVIFTVLAVDPQRRQGSLLAPSRSSGTPSPQLEQVTGNPIDLFP